MIAITMFLTFTLPGVALPTIELAINDEIGRCVAKRGPLLFVKSRQSLDDRFPEDELLRQWRPPFDHRSDDGLRCRNVLLGCLYFLFRCGCFLLRCGCWGLCCGCLFLRCSCWGLCCGCFFLSCGCWGFCCGCLFLRCSCWGLCCGCFRDFCSQSCSKKT